MPIHLNDLDVSLDVAGLKSVLIVPCDMCPAVTVATKMKKPFLQPLKHGLRSMPFKQHIETLQSKLKQVGVETTVFKSRYPHHWFMCMWTAGRRAKLKKAAEKHDAVIVLGCETATETVGEAVKSLDCKVIEGMAVSGLMNAKLKIRWPCNVTFDDCRTVPFSPIEPGMKPDLNDSKP